MFISVRRTFFLFIVVLFVCSRSFSYPDPENARFRHFFIEQGLSNNSARAILQDKKGFIWVGTEDGLNKFNGYSWTVYKNDPQDTTSISFGNITSLYEDKVGQIWIGIDGGGVNIFNTHTSKFTHLTNNPSDPNSLVSNHVKYILEDKDGLFWIATWKGLNCYDKTTGRFNLYRNTSNPHSISNNDIKYLYEDKDGVIWIATTVGLNSFDKKNSRFTRYFNNSDKSSFTNNNDFMCIAGDALDPDVLWLGTNGGLACFSKSKAAFILYKHEKVIGNGPSYNDIKVIRDDKADLLIGTFAGGVNIFNKKTKKFTYYVHSENNYQSLSDNYVQSIIKDSEGILWIGTKGGVNTLNPEEFKFSYYKHDPSRSVSLSNNSVWSFSASDNENLWIGTKRGVNLFNKKTKVFRNGSHNSSIPQIPGNKDLNCLFDDGKANLWIGTTDGLFVFDKKIKKIKSVEQGLSNNKITFIFQDKDSVLWVGTFDGLNASDHSKSQFRTYKNIYGQNNNIFYCGVQDKEGNLWFGTFGGGLYRYDKRKGKLNQVGSWTGKSKEANHYVISLYADAENNIWIGTYGEGLYCYNNSKNKFEHYTSKDGLPSNVINGIIADKHQNLWLSTNNGLCRFNVKGNGSVRFRNYDKNQGFPSLDFNAGAVYKDNEVLYFGASNGIIAFDPDSLRDKLKPPPVVITQFKVLEQEFPLDSTITDKKSITLSYNQNFFSFEFAALSYAFPENNSYAYKMVGIDTGWIDGNKRHYVSYTNLDPGKYTFKVKGANNIGVWNNEGTSLSITITPPFWKTIWFSVLLGIVLFFIAYGVIRFREKNLEKEKELSETNKRIAEFKLIALRSQMNPHFIFNSLSAIQYFITTNNKESAINYLSKFAKLIRRILENSIHTKILLEDEIDFINRYLEIESLRFENRLEYFIEVDESIDEHNIEIPSMLIQPFIENSIIHGLMNKNGKGIIKINIRNQNNYITCIVEDNGVGRQEAAKIKESKIIEHKSIGMAVTDDRLQILNRDKENKVSMQIEDLFDESGNPAGTRVVINIPIED